MMGMITILVFSAMISLPMFYIITRAIFPKKSKKSALQISIVLTILLLAIFTISLLKVA